MEEPNIRGVFYKLLISFLFIFLIAAEVSTVNVQAQKKASVTGTVVDEDGNPISGANVTLFAFDRRLIFKKRVTTDAAGRFYASVDKEGSYLIYVTCDYKETPGMDYVPERWRTWLSSNSVSSRQFILKKGASIYLDGEIRYIKTNKLAISYQFYVLELEGKVEKDYWTGPVREYGSLSNLVRFLGFDKRLVVVPADTEVKIQVKAYFPAKHSQTFILAGKTGYFKLPQGEVLHIDVREHNILSNIEYVKEMLSSGFTLLDDCLSAGFLVEAEKRDLLNAYSEVEESLSLLKKGLFDQSFAKLRSAYIRTKKAQDMLRGLIQSSSQSLLPSLLLFVFMASASAYLISEKSTCFEITAGNRRLLISITSLAEIILYVFLVVLFYIVFPGCRLTTQLTFIIMSTCVFLAGKASVLLFLRLAREKESGNRPIQLKSAIAAAFSMGSRNLRRRKMRTTLNLMNIMMLVFGFIVLTSISPGYGLLVRESRPVLPINALLIKDKPLGSSVGSFVSLPDSFIDWLKSQPNVTLISPKAENTPVFFDNPLGTLYSASGRKMEVLGVIGIVPSSEANLTGFDRIVNEGNYLEDGDLKGILVSSFVRESLGVNVGDKLYGFGQEFIIRGFFDEDALSKLVDIDGLTFLPYYRDPMTAPEPIPCPSSYVIILTYEEALTLPKVSTSRVAVQLSNAECYKSLAKIIALTYEYVVYASRPESLTLYYLEEYIEEQGLGLMPLLMSLVMLNIGASMFAAVNERKNEIASLSSVGLNPTHIAALFVAEALIIGFTGGGFGYLLGMSGYRLATFLGLQVREKVSAEWGLASIFLSELTVVIASLIPALRSSTLVTPSLLRKWRIEESEHPIGADKPWVLDLPIKLMARELEPFTAFIVKQLRGYGQTAVDEISLEREPSQKGIVRKIKFAYYLPEKAGWTENEIIIQSGEEEYDLKLICSLRGSPPHPRDTVHMTATFVRKLILQWSAATLEVATPFDPYLSQIYNLVNAYNPTTVYIVSTYSDIDDKIEKLRAALVSKGIRPPMFSVSRVNPNDVEQTMKAIKDSVSRADIVCVSGDHSMLCSALAIEAVKQKKTICYVIDDRPIEKRMKNPFQDLKIVSFS